VPPHGQGLPPTAALKELAEVLGDNDTRELVRTFLQDFPATLRMLASGKHEDRLRMAHGLKSSARHMGADALSRRMAALEVKLSQSGAAEGIPSTEDLSIAVEEFERAAALLRPYAGR